MQPQAVEFDLMICFFCEELVSIDHYCFYSWDESFLPEWYEEGYLDSDYNIGYN